MERPTPARADLAFSAKQIAIEPALEEFWAPRRARANGDFECLA